MDKLEFGRVKPFYFRFKEDFLKEVTTEQEKTCLFMFFTDENALVRTVPPSPAEEIGIISRIHKEFEKMRQFGSKHFPREECTYEATERTYQSALKKLRDRCALYHEEVHDCRHEPLAVIPLDWWVIKLLKATCYDSTVRIARATDRQLLSIRGIGPVTLKQIRVFIPFDPEAGKVARDRRSRINAQIRAGQKGLGI